MPLFLLGWAKGLLSVVLRLASDPKALAYLAGVILISGLALQTSLLHHAKTDLGKARAALVDPATHRKWQDEAVEAKRDLTTCRATTSTLNVALDRQNASVAVLKADGDRKAAEAEKAASEARSALETAEKARAQIAAPLKPADTCDEVFRRSRESLK